MSNCKKTKQKSKILTKNEETILQKVYNVLLDDACYDSEEECKEFILCVLERLNYHYSIENSSLTFTPRGN